MCVVSIRTCPVYRKWRAIEAMKEIEGTVLKEPDKEFKGGLKVPGSIWNKLYMLVPPCCLCTLC